MENRRDFLRQSGLATAAFIFAKPSENISTLPQEWFSPVVRKVKLLYGNQPQITGSAVLHVHTGQAAAAGNACYRLQKKNGVMVGLIDGNAIPSKSIDEIIHMINNTANELKKKGCQLVAFLEDQNQAGKSVCAELAGHSNNLDIIFSNEIAQPHIPQRIYLNARNHEVIVSYLPSPGKKAHLLTFGFDANGKKNFFEAGLQA